MFGFDFCGKKMKADTTERDPTDYQGVESIFEYLIIVKSLTSLGVRSVYSSFYR